jgi:hypothetical protein
MADPRFRVGSRFRSPRSYPQLRQSRAKARLRRERHPDRFDAIYAERLAAHDDPDARTRSTEYRRSEDKLRDEFYDEYMELLADERARARKEPGDV